MTREKIEQRSQPRIVARVPLTVSTKQAEVKTTGHTRDLSSSGIFFYTEFPIQQGNEVEMVLILPPELTSGEKRWVCCQATVVRVEENEDGNRGVAAQVRSMEFLPELVG